MNDYTLKKKKKVMHFKLKTMLNEAIWKHKTEYKFLLQLYFSLISIAGKQLIPLINSFSRCQNLRQKIPGPTFVAFHPFWLALYCCL